jgi:hypothetical protein
VSLRASRQKNIKKDAKSGTETSHVHLLAACF